ncbi:polynucleotide kinase-phosphatase [Luteolibacter sp. GHJ8]|uniref:Polynucleotide kinase-phosphatase n=1 Tax=Luteolibacter rhizosphaerae TaxID=2989719 RepID=A0ABT3FY78_9BACT|nr:polynucleotide kinase-phosphatase [Luteolibacter rhizosphaerae]MCW1912546.1 polynucleotide kinase-phosphatase [Luteolibacter rhizosphaerae]
MTLRLPELSLVLLIGPSGSGKSTFARRHFKPTEIVSSDTCRGIVSDDENDQSVSAQAFQLLNFIVRQRLALGRLTVVDATNVDPAARAELVAIAREYHFLPAALVFKIPESVCHARNATRPDRNFGPNVVKRQANLLRQGLRNLKTQGFRNTIFFTSEEEVDAVQGIEREPLWNNRKSEHGPFDIIGDVHGCYEELRSLIGELGYSVTDHVASHPEGRQLLFVGDLVDRGPDAPSVLRLAMASVKAGSAICVPGNHDMKFLRWLNGKNVQLTHGLADTIAQLEADPIDRRDLIEFLDKLVSHYVFDDGKLVVAHAGLKEEMQGRGSGKVREFCLYGETTGERDEYGLPERLDWARDYRGKALVVYGHTPFAAPRWLNHTVNIDTGCCFGGALTALRYPELETISVPALRTYAESVRPLLPETGPDAQLVHDHLLDLDDLRGRRFIDTGLRPAITVKEENMLAALEVMSRFSVDPRWLVYLPPTMSPCGTSKQDGWLERPEEAFAYFREQAVTTVICEEKHMGSRSVAVVCRDPALAVTRFGLKQERRGVIYTRTGRPFFNDLELEQALLDRLALAMEKSGLWEDLGTDWLCLDCELMPWSAKAMELLQSQYAGVGAAAIAHAAAVAAAMQAGEGNSLLEDSAKEHLAGMMARNDNRLAMLDRYREAYRHYCWDTDGLQGLKLAPFHFLAGEGGVLTQHDHVWHMEMAARLNAADPELFPLTRWREVTLEDEASVADATTWWEELTAAGGEGMVVKPRDFIAKGKRGLVQPAVKCRGREYLRIIYGPEYDHPEHLVRLKERGLGHKRSMAEREFALGIEGLSRFAARRPLREVHECVLAVLAMESEPVDPRL